MTLYQGFCILYVEVRRILRRIKMTAYQISIIPENETVPRLTKTIHAELQQEVKDKALLLVHQFYHNSSIYLKTEDYISYLMFTKYERYLGKVTITKGTKNE